MANEATKSERAADEEEGTVYMSIPHIQSCTVPRCMKKLRGVFFPWSTVQFDSTVGFMKECVSKVVLVNLANRQLVSDNEEES